MMTGLPPNYSENKTEMFKNIMRMQPGYPSHLSI
jgi:hypothetical protein